jgi:hypothetical protein
MKISEIRDMINSTITENGAGEITGKSLNAALHSILDYVVDNGSSSNGSLGGALTILIPNDASWDDDNSNVELLENNAQCFATLANQTEPLLVFLKRFGATKPLAQTAMRMRHLDGDGEGTKYFAFGYPVPYTDEEKYGLLAYSEEMFAIEASGNVRRITLLGKEYGTNEDIIWKCDVDILHYIEDSYIKSSSNPEITVGMNDVKITSYDGETISIKGLFDENIEFKNIPIDNVNSRFIIDKNIVGKDNLETNLLGPVQLPITLNIETTTIYDKTFVIKLYSSEQIGCYGSNGNNGWYGYINDFTLTRDLPFKL